MPLPPRLLEKLVCPNCKGKLWYQTELERLDCTACKLGYNIVDGIPVLLVDEAEKLSS